MQNPKRYKALGSHTHSSLYSSSKENIRAWLSRFSTLYRVCCTHSYSISPTISTTILWGPGIRFLFPLSFFSSPSHRSLHRPPLCSTLRAVTDAPLLLPADPDRLTLSALLRRDVGRRIAARPASDGRKRKWDARLKQTHDAAQINALGSAH